MGPNYKFNYTTCPNLPKLAWCMQLGAGTSAVNVLHGAWVETRESGFFEGAWASEFDKANYDATFMTGTGAKLCPQGLMLVTPNHTLDRLNVVRKQDVMYISNSLPYVLAASDEDIDSDFLYYDSYMSSIKFGVKRYEPTIPTRSGNCVRLYYFCNLLLNAKLDLTALTKKSSPTFIDFHHYKSFIQMTVRQLAQNAQDPRRIIEYKPIGTVSRGYDSPAALVVAKAAGCTEALTFSKSRGTNTDEDCGTEIASTLGVTVREFDRLQYRQHDDFPEVLNSGGPNEFLSFAEHLARRLLFTGFHGDKVWDKHCDKVTKDFVRGDASGSSLTELRLQAGFAHMPVPFIGADRHPDIYRISNSKEMVDWSMGNFYDRPIARRLVEEAGVPRHMFGRQKRAAGVVVPNEGLAETMSPTSLIDFEEFCRLHWSWTKSLRMRYMTFIKKAVYYNQGAAKLLSRIAYRLSSIRICIPMLVPHSLNMRSYGYLGKEAYLFHWGTRKLISRYMDAIAKPHRRDGEVCDTAVE
jgi:hypothetical protein